MVAQWAEYCLTASDGCKPREPATRGNGTQIDNPRNSRLGRLRYSGSRAGLPVGLPRLNAAAMLRGTTMRHPLRMQSVQTPIIPVVADLIRQCPGTISLGQGVVSYGPPPQAIESIQGFLADPENHKYKPVQGLPPRWWMPSKRN
jgi:hypothetical protein